METLEFHNQSGRARAAAIFADADAATGQQAVAWQVLRAGPGGVARFVWPDALSAVLATKRGSILEWTHMLALPAGRAVSVREDRGVLSLAPGGDAPSADQITIRNDSRSTVNAGIAYDDAPVLWVRGLSPMRTACFHVPLDRYRIGIYDEIAQGELYSPPTVGPCPLHVTPRLMSVTLTLREENQLDVMTIDCRTVR
jgi:hypothetical protein